MITLALDASTYDATVAVFDGTTLVAAGGTAMRERARDALFPAVLNVLADAGVSLSRVDRVICGEGPGSFTSLRIAGSIAKGIAYGLPRPLLAVSSLGLIVAADAARKPGRYLAVLDALREESYVAAFEVLESGAVVPAGPVGVLSNDSIASRATAEGVARIGPREDVRATPQAHGALRLRSAAGARRGEDRGPTLTVDVATWQPMYGRLAEAQVKWEAASGRRLDTAHRP